MITDRDMRDQVREVLGADVEDFDVEAIVDHIQRDFGTVHIEKVPDGRFWAIVRHHTRIR
jgi:hypothetical protein